MAQRDLRRVAAARKRVVRAEQALTAAIVAAYQSGETLRDIAVVAEVSHQRVHQIIREALRLLELE